MITVIINGQSFDYPEVGDTEWGDAATVAFQSLCATTLQKSASSFTLENELDFGGANGIKVLFISSRSNDPAESGVFRLSKGELISWRNDDNTDDFSITTDPVTGDLLIKSNGVDENNDPIVITKRVLVSGEVVNDDIAAGAGIEESKLALDYSTDSLHTLISDKALYNLADTDLPDPTSTPPDTPPNNQDVLLYDNNDSKWKNSNLLSSHVGNTTNPHLTNIVNLVDTTVVTPTKDDTLLYDDVDSKWKNKPNTVANLKDTTINTPLSGQVLTYDGDDSTWKNQPSASASLTGLTDTDISTTPPPNNGDVLSFDNNDSKWKNSNALTSHLGNKNNPHETSVNNLDDTNIDSNNFNDEDVLLYDLANQEWVNSNKLSSHITDTNNPHSTSIDNLSDSDIDSDTLTENDVMVFNDQTSKWENSQILVNHIGNTANPHLTTVSKLTDTTISSLADKQLLQYDLANLQWVNSSDVWNTIEVNDIANINSATADITLTASDKRYQIFSTATDGFNITMPSTGIKAGETFYFKWTQGFETTITTPFVFYSSNNTVIVKNRTKCFIYKLTALVNNPTSETDWLFSYEIWYNKEIHATNNTPISLTANSLVNSRGYGSTFITIPYGYWELDMSCVTRYTNPVYSYEHTVSLCTSGNVEVTSVSGEKIGWGIGSGGYWLMGLGNSTKCPWSKTVLVKINGIYSLKMYYQLYSSTTQSDYLYTHIAARLVAPYTE